MLRIFVLSRRLVDTNSIFLSFPEWWNNLEDCRRWHGCSCVDSYRRCFLELLSNSLNEVGTFRINLLRKRLGCLGVSVLESRLRGLDSRPCLVIVLCLWLRHLTLTDTMAHSTLEWSNTHGNVMLVTPWQAKVVMGPEARRTKTRRNYFIKYLFSALLPTVCEEKQISFDVKEM